MTQNDPQWGTQDPKWPNRSKSNYRDLLISKFQATKVASSHYIHNSLWMEKSEEEFTENKGSFRIHAETLQTLICMVDYDICMLHLFSFEIIFCLDWPDYLNETYRTCFFKTDNCCGFEFDIVTFIPLLCLRIASATNVSDFNIVFWFVENSSSFLHLLLFKLLAATILIASFISLDCFSSVSKRHLYVMLTSFNTCDQHI